MVIAGEIYYPRATILTLGFSPSVRIVFSVAYIYILIYLIGFMILDYQMTTKCYWVLCTMLIFSKWT